MSSKAATKDRLAQYFTPEPVVAFALDALAALGLRPGPLRVVDPACGEGAFLLAAARRLPEAELWGCDLDESLAPRWQAAGLAAPRAHMLLIDGLVDAPLLGLGAGTFDLVMGNPPYGFGVSRPGKGEPIEALFLRRLVALARPGGWLAAVLPEGIVANARAQRLRDWLLDRVALEAVIALPAATFASTGTRARTVLVIAQKAREAGRGVLMAEPGEGVCPLEGYLAEVLDAVARTRGRV